MKEVPETNQYRFEPFIFVIHDCYSMIYLSMYYINSFPFNDAWKFVNDHNFIGSQSTNHQ